ncbi:hypothetical protein [Neptuniibacter halophilus]|uniref:hypothetical protein n=1 Tax=Neptuniibacter halophilus TaxID=651666 RepID=UPI0025728F6B|nr:hypothetical protein [Neptuniibacter halophilus]
MLIKTMFALAGAFLLAACSDSDSNSPSHTNQEIKGQLIPRSMAEKADYYLIALEADRGYLKATHSRISSMSHGYSHTLIDCQNSRYRAIGYGEGSVENIKQYPNSPWTELIQGSSKADLVKFVCSQR